MLLGDKLLTVTDILKDHFYCHFTQTPLRQLDSEAADTMISQNTGNFVLFTHNTAPHPSTPETLVMSLLFRPSPSAKTRLLSFNRTHTRVVICLLTGHNTMRRHLHFTSSIVPYVGGVEQRMKPRSTFSVRVSLWLHSDMYIRVRFSWIQRILRV